MITMLYFDWTGTTEELHSCNNMIKEMCERHNVIHTGLFNRREVKWLVWVKEHHSIVLESTSFEPIEKIFNELSNSRFDKMKNRKIEKAEKARIEKRQKE